MNLKDFFLRQLAYNDHMNITMLNRLKEMPHPPQECIKLLSHITWAQIIWLRRLYDSNNRDKNFWDVLSLPEIEDKLKDNHQGWLSFLNEVDEDDLNKTYSYYNS